MAECARLVYKEAILEAVYKEPIITGIPIIKDLITLPLVATQTKAIEPIIFVKSPRGIKLMPGRTKAKNKATGIRKIEVTTTEGIPTITATSKPI